MGRVEYRGEVMTPHDLEEAAARKALEAAARAFKAAQYDPAPYTRGMEHLRRIDPTTFRTDRNT